MKRSLTFTLLLVAALLAGCLSKPRHGRETFAIVTPTLAKAAPTTGQVLVVQRISVAQPFDTPSLTYRTGQFSYERDPYADFLDSPGASFAEPIRAWVQNAGLFRVVVGLDSTLKADWRLETSITQLHGDFHDRAHPSAVLEMQFLLFKKSGRSDDDIVFQKTYLRRIPLNVRTAAAVVSGWNEGLQEIMKEFTGDLKNERPTAVANGLSR